VTDAAVATPAGATVPATDAPAKHAARAPGGAATPAAASATGSDARASAAVPKKASRGTGDADADREPAPDVEEGIDTFVRGMSTARLRDPKRRWHAADNPADVSWLPAFGDRLFNHKLETVAANARRYASDQTTFIKAFVAALPTALFLMMPFFALLLRLFYVRRRQGVLEHLVVALYSHAFLLLAMMAIFLLWAIGSALVAPVGAFVYLLMTFVMIYIPVYLLLMQKRVYGQGWPRTLVKYVLIGGAYQLLLGFAASFAALLPFLGGD
jgi:hypothetical protein